MGNTQGKTKLPDWAIAVKGVRLFLGESQEQFGARFGVGKMAVSYWESGTNEPGAAVLMFVLKGVV